MTAYLTGQPYIVLDQNLCRDPQCVEGRFRQCRKEGLAILLPDTAIYEFSKGSLTYQTWRRSLKHLCKEPQLVATGRSIGRMMSEEIQTGQPIHDVVDHEVTPRFQRLLAELRNGEDKRINLALAEVAKIIDHEKGLRDHHQENKGIVARLRDHWHDTVSNSDLSRLRRQDEETLIGVLAEMETAAIVFQAAKNDGCTDDVAYAITLGPSVYSHAVYSLAALALDWLAQGGLEGIEPSKITNDFHDLDYVRTATFCTDLVTDDKRASRVYGVVVTALERRWETIKAHANEQQ